MNILVVCAAIGLAFHASVTGYFTYAGAKAVAFDRTSIAVALGAMTVWWVVLVALARVFAVGIGMAPE